MEYWSRIRGYDYEISSKGNVREVDTERTVLVQRDSRWPWVAIEPRDIKKFRRYPEIDTLWKLSWKYNLQTSDLYGHVLVFWDRSVSS